MRLDLSLHLVSPPPLLTCRATCPTRRAAPRSETCRTASSVRHAHTSKDTPPDTYRRCTQHCPPVDSPQASRLLRQRRATVMRPRRAPTGRRGGPTHPPSRASQAKSTTTPSRATSARVQWPRAPSRARRVCTSCSPRTTPVLPSLALTPPPRPPRPRRRLARAGRRRHPWIDASMPRKSGLRA